MSNNNLMPFSKELWETGEYEFDKKHLVSYHGEFEGVAFYLTTVDLPFWTSKNTVEPEKVTDLMLRKKTKCTRCKNEPKHKESIYCIDCLYQRTMEGF